MDELAGRFVERDEIVIFVEHFDRQVFCLDVALLRYGLFDLYDIACAKSRFEEGRTSVEEDAF